MLVLWQSCRANNGFHDRYKIKIVSWGSFIRTRGMDKHRNRPLMKYSTENGCVPSTVECISKMVEKVNVAQMHKIKH